MTTKQFLEDIDTLYDAVPYTGCWIWKGFLMHGYGGLWLDGRNVSVHRIMYSLFRGPIPDGLCVCHKCDERSCINPDHFFLGTKADNNKDMRLKGRHKGERAGSTLKTGQVWEIKRLLKTEITQREIAAMYGVTATAIGLIKRGINWKHLSDKEGG